MAMIRGASFCLLFFSSFFVLEIVQGNPNYKDALEKSILFFQGQRSGKLPESQQIKWRSNSGLKDGQLAQVDLTGGYYDAGDNVKFNLPMAYTTTMLSWSTLEYGKRMDSLNQLESARVAIRWATDYLLKCATATPGTLYVGVGDPNEDHKCWERPEDMDTIRTVYSVTSSKPGSDVAGETAAALAAASLVFRKVDPEYSKLLLKTAKDVMEFAMQYQAGADATDIFSWDSKSPGAHVLLAREALLNNNKDLEPFIQQAEDFMCKILPDSPSSSSKYTPGGLLFKLPDNNLQYVTTTTFLLTTYAKYMAAQKHTFNCGSLSVTPSTLRTLAKKQVDYILGENPLKMSYMVGFGPNFPKRIHHRGSSLPSVTSHPETISCQGGFDPFMHSTDPNPNILTGAIVGGPNDSDGFPDDRGDYSHSEPTTYINAAFVGPLAYFAKSSYST